MQIGRQILGIEFRSKIRGGRRSGDVGLEAACSASDQKSKSKSNSKLQLVYPGTLAHPPTLLIVIVWKSRRRGPCLLGSHWFRVSNGCQL